jgi:hypothetical protein
MNRLRPRIEKETEAEQNQAGRYHHGLVLCYRSRRLTLSAGSADSIHAWSEGDRLFVLTTNAQHGYAGLEEFVIEPKLEQGDEGFRSGGNVFMQHDWELPEGFFDWPEHKMRDHLIQYLQ